MSGDFFIENGTEYSVYVEQTVSNVTSNAIDPAVTVDASITLEHLSSNDVLVNDYITVTGSGFSANPKNNVLMFGDIVLPVLSATNNQLSFRVPFDAEAGIYEIKVRRNDLSSDVLWSNSLYVEISESTISIRVCDNGGAKDDNFALDVNGVRIGQTNTSRGNYCFLFPVRVPQGVNSATLTGLEAPDNIGTYSIDFFGVDSVSGAPLTGTDLVPGSAPKTYRFVVSGGAQQLSDPLEMQEARVPFVIPLTVPVKHQE